MRIVLCLSLCFVAESGYAVSSQGCVSGETIQEFTVSSKTGGVVWIDVGKVGVYEDFLQRTNYELIQFLYAWDVIADPNGERFGIFEGGNIHLYNFSDYKKIKKTSTKAIKDWSHLSSKWLEGTDQILFVGSKDGQLGIARFDVMIGSGGVVPVGPEKGYKSSSFDKTGSKVAIGFQDGHIAVHSAGDGKLLHQYSVHSSEVWTVALHPSRNVITSSAGDNRIIFYDLDKQQTLSIISGSAKFLDFTSNGNNLIVADWEHVGLYDLQGKPLERFAAESPYRFYPIEKLQSVYINDSENICWRQFSKWGQASQGPALASGAQEPLYGGKPLSHYVQELQKNDVTARLMALQALEHMGPVAKPAIPAMMQLWDLKEGDHEGFWRGSVLQTLAAMGSAAKETIPKIIEAMRDPNASVRKVAALALAQMKSEAREAVPALIDLTNDSVAEVQEAAILALGEIGPDAKAAIPRLKILRKEKNPLIKFRADDAIKKIEGKWP